MTIQELIQLAKVGSGATSLRHLSRILMLHPQVPHSWEKGQSLPSDENMVKLAKLASFDEAEALLMLAILRTDGDARATYQAMLSEYKKRAA